MLRPRTGRERHTNSVIEVVEESVSSLLQALVKIEGFRNVLEKQDLPRLVVTANEMADLEKYLNGAAKAVRDIRRMLREDVESATGRCRLTAPQRRAEGPGSRWHRERTAGAFSYPEYRQPSGVLKRPRSLDEGLLGP
jgi:hypothetical protein